MKMLMAVVIAVMMTAVRVVMGVEVYKVGDSAGWTNVGHVDYKTWAATKLFRVGDTIVFNYNKEFQNVVRVTYIDFLTCNGTAPYATYTSGNDTFAIVDPGHYYFICTLPGHCESGQKVDIRVPLAGGHTSPPSGAGCSPAPMQPLPFPYPPPPVTTPSPLPVKPSPTQSPAPAVPEESPSPTPAIPTPQNAPSPPKSTTSKLVINLKFSTALMAVLFFLIAFSC